MYSEGIEEVVSFQGQTSLYLLKQCSCTHAFEKRAWFLTSHCLSKGAPKKNCLFQILMVQFPTCEKNIQGSWKGSSLLTLLLFLLKTMLCPWEGHHTILLPTCDKKLSLLLKSAVFLPTVPVSLPCTLFLTSSLGSHHFLGVFLCSWASSSTCIPKTTGVTLVAAYVNSIWSQFHPDTLLHLEIQCFIPFNNSLDF